MDIYINDLLIGNCSKLVKLKHNNYYPALINLLKMICISS